MKLCNFRPMVCLALVVMAAIGSAMLSLWLTVTLAVFLFSLLWFSKLPAQFKIVVMTGFAVAVFSYLLTTCFVANPYQCVGNPNAGLRGVILGYVRWYLNLFLSPKNANILYAMIFGDKSVLAGSLRSDFTVSGLAHMLAVSGFHVDLLYLILCNLLRWCRIPKRTHLWIVTPIILFYGYLCGWHYAVMRAVIMCLVYAVAKHRLRVADSLSVLSLAAVVILLIYPYALVSVSFLLSFACVLGINLWFAVIYRAIPVKAVAMYLAVMAGAMPIMIYFFGEVPVFGLVANVILQPMLVLTFYLGIFAVGTFVCGAVLWLAEPLLNFVRWVTNAIGQIPWATIPMQHGLSAVFVYLLASIILSRFVFLKPKIKSTLAGVLFTCYFVLLVV